MSLWYTTDLLHHLNMNAMMATQVICEVQIKTVFSIELTARFEILLLWPVCDI